MLIGNKLDLEESREVPTETAQQYAEKEGMAIIETSALDSTNVTTSFEAIIKGKYSSL
jgi:Ras-related protein Rab-11A